MDSDVRHYIKPPRIDRVPVVREARFRGPRDPGKVEPDPQPGAAKPRGLIELKPRSLTNYQFITIETSRII